MRHSITTTWREFTVIFPSKPCVCVSRHKRRPNNNRAAHNRTFQQFPAGPAKKIILQVKIKSK